MSTNTKLVAGLIVIAAIAIVGWMLMSKSGQPYQAPQTQIQPQQTETQQPTATTQASVKEFTVTGTPFKFDPAEIKVKVGDKVKVTFKNGAGMHNLTIKDLNVATKTIKAGEEDTVEFIADKAGTFQYMCSVPTHADKGMVGNLVVE